MATMLNDANNELDENLKFILFNVSTEFSQESTGDDTDSTRNEFGILYDTYYSAEPYGKPKVGDNITVQRPLVNSLSNNRIHEINWNKNIALSIVTWKH